jgi:hypothetical protein
MRRTLAVASAVGLLAGVASADVTTEQGASILFFPKVIAAGTRDTIIQIANTSNMMVYAHCFYVNAGLKDPTQPFDPIFNPQLWQETDFDIALTRQQPTMWVASQGRRVDPNDPLCTKTPSKTDCYGAGIDPGAVPQTILDFTGELKCIETDQFGSPGSNGSSQSNPLPGNHLKGEATLVNTSATANNGDVSKYNAIGIKGDPAGVGAVSTNGVLCLGGDGSTAPCDTGGSPAYAACPQTWILNHFAEGAEDSIAKDAGLTGSSVGTELTVVPCTENFETQTPTPVTIQFSVTNEFETSFSASTTVTCWANLKLEDISNAFTRTALQTDYAQTRMRSTVGGTSGFLIVAEEFHNATIVGVPRTAAGAFNPHQEGSRVGPDLITLPGGQHGDNP